MADHGDNLVAVSLYRNLPEWKDIQPIYCNEDEECVIRIAASEEFTDAFAYLRAVMKANELSERAFNLTKTCVILNAANYSVWQFRRSILKALNKNIDEELNFCENSTLEYPKNYQVWHHRKVLVKLSGNSTKELNFTATLLQEDQKNYHAWQYRQWVVEFFNLFSHTEIEFSTNCIVEDLRNNSAWNYRYFVALRLSDEFENKDFLEKEIKFTLHCILKIPNNESSWNYLYGLLELNGLNSNDQVNKFCDESLTNDAFSKSVHLRNFVVDCIIEKLEKGEDIESNAQKANQILNSLEQLDPIRTKYWRYRRLFVINFVNLL